MTGLLIKDFKLLMAQKNALLMVGVIAVGLTFNIKNPSFVISYLTFIGVMYAMNTLSYDAFDNGNAFLFSLPVSRKGYVAEKYVFCFLGGAILWAASIVLTFAVSMAKGIHLSEEIAMNAFVAFLLMLFLLAFLLPIELKFGGEKARIMVMVTAGLIFAIGLAVVKAGKGMNIDLTALLNLLSEAEPAVLAAVFLGAGIVILGISCRISIAIMNKKEF